MIRSSKLFPTLSNLITINNNNNLSSVPFRHFLKPCTSSFSLFNRHHAHPSLHSLFFSTTTEMSTTSLMRAIIPDGQGGTTLTNVPIPRPSQPGQRLLKVHSVGMNRADLLQISGKYPPPSGTTSILGLEACGYFIDHENPKQQQPQPVIVLLRGGAFAEYCLVSPDSNIVPLHTNTLQTLSMYQLAAIPEAFIAAYHIAFDLGKINAQDIIFINAAASGVGIALIQLIRSSFENAQQNIIACVGTDEKCKFLKHHFNLQHIINYNDKTDSISNVIQHMTNGKGINLAIDCVGAAQFKDIEKSMAKNGRWIIYGLLSGAKHRNLGLAGIVTKHLTIHGTTLRSRSETDRARIINEFANRFGNAFAPQGNIIPVVHKQIHGLENASDAFGMMERNENIGKIVLTL